MLNDYEAVKKDSRVTCVGLYFTNDKALTKVTHVLFTDVNHIEKLCLVYYVPK